MPRSRTTRRPSRRARLAPLLALLPLLWAPASASADHEPPGTYENPLEVAIPGGGAAETFADPAVIRGRDGVYYAYGTSDPLSGADRDASGALVVRRIPIARSTDLVHWTYVGDAFAGVPAWLAPTAGMWAPEVRYLDDRYVLYYTATDTADAVSGEPGCAGDSAIGVATAPTPTGPWTDSGAPAVAPRRAGRGCDFYWTFDAAVVNAGTERFLYYGSYYGGIEARRLAPDGLTTDPASATRIAIGDRYEGAYVIRRRGWYWFFGSATDCCRGPLTGYSVFTGRSRGPLGPFVDRNGNALTDPRVGGTPVISMNGNRWIGTGHNSVIRDEAGQDWFVYHAIDRTAPYLAAPNPANINRRPMLMDRLTWVDGWPSVRAERWASDSPQPAPVTAAGGTPSAPPTPRLVDAPGGLRSGPSDEFDDGVPERGWTWVRAPAETFPVHPGRFVFPTQDGDIFQDSNTAPLLVRPAPRRDFLVEVRFRFDLPPTGIFNFQQAGVALLQDDDSFVKLSHASIWGTRQTEWAKEVPEPVTPLLQRYGNTVVGPPARPGVTPATTWLRIVRRTDPRTAEQRYTAYTSVDARRWVRGGTWTHRLQDVRIALFAFGGRGHTAEFEHVRVHDLATPEDPEIAAEAPAAAPATRSLAAARRAGAAVGRQDWLRRAGRVR